MGTFAVLKDGDIQNMARTLSAGEDYTMSMDKVSGTNTARYGQSRREQLLKLCQTFRSNQFYYSWRE